MKLLLLPILLTALTNGDIERVLISHLNSYYPLDKAEYVCDLSHCNFLRAADYDSVSVDGFGKKIPKGQVVVKFSFFKAGQRTYKTAATVDIGILKKALVAKCDIKPGEPFDSEKITTKTMDVSSIGFDLLEPSDQLEGLVAAKYIPAGRVLSDDCFRIPPIVLRGEQVEIRLEEGAFRLKTQGIARSEGAKGERIKVMNADTRKIIEAVIVDSALVIIAAREEM